MKMREITKYVKTRRSSVEANKELLLKDIEVSSFHQITAVVEALDNHTTSSKNILILPFAIFC